ncbi:MAG: hypothetical protein JWR15_2031, partial [Prosthecobacter sp.]|nr:hypothetical protein [Prosthecobacter sp.]
TDCPISKKFRTMTCRLTLCFLILAACQTGHGMESPVAAEIVNVPDERRDWGMPIGNVRVRFANGRREMWTRQGRCLLVRRSASGLVGWSRYTSRNLHDEPVNNILRVMIAPERWMDFQAGSFIQAWDFAENDTSVVVHSAGRHGPGTVLRFSLKTGNQTGSARVGAPAAKLPAWAQAYAGDRNR